MNQTILSGRLTADPDIKTSAKTAVASFNLAVDRDYKKEGEPTADFFNCVCFGKVAEALGKYVSKGKKILVSGCLQNSSYEKDGVKHYTTKILVNKWEFADGKDATAAEEKPKEKPKSDSKPAQAPAQEQVTIDDVPFF